MATLLNRRRYMGGGSSLPYDAEIEYLESTGSQYIDTGIKLFDVSPASFNIYLDVFVNTGNANYSCVLNAMYEARPYPGMVIRTNNSNQIIQSEERVTDQVIGACGTRVTFTVSKTNATVSVHTVNTTLFAGLNGSLQPWRYCKMKLYGCQISKNEVIVRDYIPVRVGQTGYLYDKVSGTLFGNEGTGSFTLGPDKT